jgi:hypothetical protein
MHFGTFQLTDEAIDAPPEALATAREQADLAPGRFMTPGFGETRLHKPGRPRRVSTSVRQSA